MQATAPEHGEDIIAYKIFPQVINEDLFHPSFLCLDSSRLQLLSLQQYIYSFLQHLWAEQLHHVMKPITVVLPLVGI